MNNKTLLIYAKKFNKKDGGTFLGFYRVSRLTGKFTHHVKCTMDCGSLPIKEPGFYELEVNDTEMSLQKSKQEGYLSTLWLQERPSNVKRAVEYEAELNKKQLEEINDILNDTDLI